MKDQPIKTLTSVWSFVNALATIWFGICMACYAASADYKTAFFLLAAGIYTGITSAATWYK